MELREIKIHICANLPFNFTIYSKEEECTLYNPNFRFGNCEYCDMLTGRCEKNTNINVFDFNIANLVEI